MGLKLAGFVPAKKMNGPLVLRPEGQERGCVALSYITWPFREGWNSPKARGHTNAFEVVAMAEAWRDLGFRVEISDYEDTRYTPPADCAIAIDLHSNLERWEKSLPAGCVRILHATGCEWRFHNEAELSRLRQIKQRRGVDLVPRRQVAPTRAAEVADHISTLGNEFTIDTFIHAGKPITRIPISSAYEFAWPERRDFETAKRNFLWMGSYGMAHKGLDLVLEAFSAMPEFRLTVCGRPEKEADFFEAYKHELTQLPNITLRGWLDPASPDFRGIANTHAAIVYPSSAEGGGGAVIHCMHAGILPACTAESSVDLGDFGVAIRSGSLEAVQAAVETIGSLDPSEVEARCKQAREHVRKVHTRGTFRRNYSAFARRLVCAS